MREFDFSFSRSPGPGGQNVNKLNTKALLRWNVAQSECLTEGVRRRFLSRYRSRISKSGEILITSHRYRDQGRNVADCLNKLRELVLAVAEKPVQRKATRPTAAAGRRRLADKKKQSQKKEGRRPPPRED